MDAKIVGSIKSSQSQNTLVKFANPFPILLIGDSDGNAFLWDISTTNVEFKLIVTWQNMFNLKKANPITSGEFIFTKEVF